MDGYTTGAENGSGDASACPHNHHAGAGETESKLRCGIIPSGSLSDAEIPAQGRAMTALLSDGELPPALRHNWMAQHGERLLAIPDLALVVLDPLQTFAFADINADPKAAALVMSLLNMLASETGATVLVAHHVRKEKEAPRNAQEARHLIRGSSALVDQSRVAVVLWTPEDKRSRQVCKEMGVEHAPNAVVLGAVVKSNDGAGRKEWTLLRGPDGTLRDVTHDLASARTSQADLANLLVAAIAAGAAAGRPYIKTGQNGLHVRRAELGEELGKVGRDRLERMAQELEEAGQIVTALANGTTVKWLDVPEGPFARGEGAFAAGFGNSKPGRKPC